MSRLKTSIIWDIPRNELIELINDANSVSDALRKIGYSNPGRNAETLKERCKKENIDIQPLIQKGISHAKNYQWATRPLIPWEEILVENSTYSRHTLKKRLLKDKIIEYKCSICGIDSFWNNKKLSLVLDHINGIYNDNRIDNLRFVCPNCNAQTETFAGKNKIKNIIKCSCGEVISRYAKTGLCLKCANRKRCRKLDIYPSKEQIEEDIQNMTWVAIGKKYGVSGNAVKKWARKLDVLIPVRKKQKPS